MGSFSQVWVITRNGIPQGAFTGQDELAMWLAAWPAEDRGRLRVWHCRTGMRHVPPVPAEVPVSDLLPCGPLRA